MKRSEINAIIRRFEKLLAEHCFEIPPYLKFTPEEWQTKGHEYDEIRDNMLGWDVTDYGMGDYATLGLALITLRNGNVHNPKYTKTYAEKIIMCDEGQVSPMHFHWSKMEDIINRGGGNLVIRLYNSLPDESLDKVTDVIAQVDGRHVRLPAGGIVTLTPGESITLAQRQYHSFWGQEGKGMVMVGEVSKVNDDHADNRFAVPAGRFPTIEEDAPKAHLLCTDYR